MLNLKHRPRKLQAIVGNDAVKASLAKVIEAGKDHSFLFTGPPGCGKTTMAYVLQNELGISDSNFYEYNMANTRGIDTVRLIIKNSEYKGFFDAGEKLYLFDEFHRQTKDALNSMLKFVEDPPAHVYIVLCTAEFLTLPETIRKAIKRRCLHYELKRIRRNELILLLKRITKREGKDFNKMLKRLSHIADMADSPGQALNYLGQVLHCKTDAEAIELLDDTFGSEVSPIDLARLLLERKFGAKAHWQNMQKVLKQLPDDPEVTRKAVLTYMEKVMLGNNFGRKAAEVADMFVTPFYHRAALVTACFWLCFGNDEDVPF